MEPGYPMGPMDHAPPPASGTFPRNAKKNQCESSPTYSLLSTLSSVSDPSPSSSNSPQRSHRSSISSILSCEDHQSQHLLNRPSMKRNHRPLPNNSCQNKPVIQDNVESGNHQQQQLVFSTTTAAVTSSQFSSSQVNSSTTNFDPELQNLSVVASGLVLLACSLKILFVLEFSILFFL